MNYIKRSLVERGIKRGVRVFRKIGVLVRTLLLPIFDLFARPWPASSFCSVKLVKRLILELCQVHDSRTIAKK